MPLPQGVDSMAIHVCKKEVEIQTMRIEIAVCQSDIKQVKDDIKEVRDDLKDMKRFARNQFVTALFTLLGMAVSIILALKG